MSLNKMLSNLDSLLQESFITKEVRLTDGIVFTIKTLSFGEQREIKEAIPRSAKEDLLLYSQVEALEMVVCATVEINGVSVQKAAMDELLAKGSDVSAIDFARGSVRKFLSKLPPAYVNHLIDSYNELVAEQNKVIEGNFGEKVENFSNPTSEK